MPSRRSTCIEWYRRGSCNQGFALNSSWSDLVDGILPCCNLLEIDCRTGSINVSRHNFSSWAPFRAPGKTMNVDLSGEAACCKNATDCTMLKNKEALAQQLLELALTYNLSGYTQDWEFGEAFNWAGYNETMTYIAGVIKPHGIGLGISIDSGCENKVKDYASGSDPTCCHACEYFCPRPPTAHNLRQNTHQALPAALPRFRRTSDT